MIGPAKTAKRFVSQLLSGLADLTVFQKANEDKHVEEKKMLYEVFAALGTNQPVPGQNMIACLFSGLLTNARAESNSRIQK